jgi:hypothetical protein
MHADGAPGDSKDDYLRMAESTSVEAMFYRAVMGKFGTHWLRGSNEEETTHIMTQNEARGSPGMLESID